MADTVRFLRCREEARLPVRATEHAAGYDITACPDQPVVLQPGCRALIPTGLQMELPVSLEAQVRPRSGLAIKNGITLLNTPGTIDADYRGEVQVIMINLGQEPFTVEPGMRIAQLVFKQVSAPQIVAAHSLSGTERGEGGFGHTGV